MEEITKQALLNDLEKGLIHDYIGTLDVGGEVRQFYRSYRGAANERTGYKIVYIVV